MSLFASCTVDSASCHNGDSAIDTVRQYLKGVCAPEVMPTSAQNNDFVLINVIGTCYWCHLMVNESFKTLLKSNTRRFLFDISNYDRKQDFLRIPVYPVQYYYFYRYIRIMNSDTNSTVFLLRIGIPILQNILHLIHLMCEEYIFF